MTHPLTCPSDTERKRRVIWMSGEEMRAIRSGWGMTQDAFAKAMGISSRERVSDMELEKRPIRITLARLIRLTDRAIKGSRGGNKQ